MQKSPSRDIERKNAALVFFSGKNFVDGWSANRCRLISRSLVKTTGGFIIIGRERKRGSAPLVSSAYVYYQRPYIRMMFFPPSPLSLYSVLAANWFSLGTCLIERPDFFLSSSSSQPAATTVRTYTNCFSTPFIYHSERVVGRSALLFFIFCQPGIMTTDKREREREEIGMGTANK